MLDSADDKREKTYFEACCDDEASCVAGFLRMEASLASGWLTSATVSDNSKKKTGEGHNQRDIDAALSPKQHEL